MENSIIEVCDEKIFYKNESYRFSIENIKNLKFGRKRSLVILGEDLYTQKVKLNKKIKFKEKDIENVIKKSFGNNEDYLFHYSISKRKLELILYAIQGGNKVKELCNGASSIKVTPLQIYFSDKFKNKIKEKEWQCLFAYKECYYYILYKDDFIYKTYVEKDISRFIDRYVGNEEKDNVVTYVDNNIFKEINNEYNNVILKDFGGILNAKKL